MIDLKIDLENSRVSVSSNGENVVPEAIAAIHAVATLVAEAKKMSLETALSALCLASIEKHDAVTNNISEKTVIKIPRKIVKGGKDD